MIRHPPPSFLNSPTPSPSLPHSHLHPAPPPPISNAPPPLPNSINHKPCVVYILCPHLFPPPKKLFPQPLSPPLPPHQHTPLINPHPIQKPPPKTQKTQKHTPKNKKMNDARIELATFSAQIFPLGGISGFCGCKGDIITTILIVLFVEIGDGCLLI